MATALLLIVNVRGEGGQYPAELRVVVKNRIQEAAEYLKEHGFPIERKQVDGISWDIGVPGFSEEKWAETLKATGLFSDAHRISMEAGPDASIITIKQAKVFTSGPNVREGAAFLRNFFTNYFQKKDPGVQVDPPQWSRDFVYNIYINGRSVKLALGESNRWEKLKFTVYMHRQLANKPDEIELQVEIADGSAAIGPMDSPPPAARYHPIENASLFIFQERVASALASENGAEFQGN
jgi:hypothetical protein